MYRLHRQLQNILMNATTRAEGSVAFIRTRNPVRRLVSDPTIPMERVMKGWLPNFVDEQVNR
jgi:hypothetical protein